MSPLEVVGAAIVGPRGVLAALRGPGMSSPGVWEFPGGKIEPGETASEALVREIGEELAVRADVGRLLGVVTTERIRLSVFLTTLHGAPVAREHAELRWVERDQLDDLRWAAADRPLLAPLADHLDRMG